MTLVAVLKSRVTMSSCCRQPLSKQNQPGDKDMFLRIPPRLIEPQHLIELFQVMDAAEITATYRFNRRDLLRLLPAREIDSLQNETAVQERHK